MNVEDIIQHVNKWPKSTAVCFSLWLPDDVLARAEERGISLTDDDVSNVLDAMHHQQDASIGINRDVMDVHLDGL